MLRRFYSTNRNRFSSRNGREISSSKKGTTRLGQLTAVKSNALAELMNRASKIHWKNLSLTLNGRNSVTKNAKNNPKVPKFSSCRGLSSTLSRKCGSTTLYAIFGLYGSVFGHFLGVIGVAQCGSMAQNMPLGPIETGEQKNLLAHNF